MQNKTIYGTDFSIKTNRKKNTEKQSNMYFLNCLREMLGLEPIFEANGRALSARRAKLNGK